MGCLKLAYYENVYSLKVVYKATEANKKLTQSFNSLDKLSELTPSLTPNHFGFNNPLSYNDPTGLASMSSTTVMHLDGEGGGKQWKSWNEMMNYYYGPNDNGSYGGSGGGMSSVSPDDWVRGKNGHIYYDPTVQKPGDVTNGGTYLGNTYMEKSKLGIINYRIDGSIMYSNENDAYERMMVIGKSREALAIGIGNKILYLPDYKNGISTSEDKSLGYELKGNKIHDPITGIDKIISFTIHTHISLYNGHTWGDDNPSDPDIYHFTKVTPNIPFITIGDYKIIGDYGSWKPRANGEYYYSDVKCAEFMNISRNQLYNGLKNIIKKNINKYGNF